MYTHPLHVCMGNFLTNLYKIHTSLDIRLDIGRSDNIELVFTFHLAKAVKYEYYWEYYFDSNAPFCVRQKGHGTFENHFTYPR